jgi:hypothetical protein
VAAVLLLVSIPPTLALQNTTNQTPQAFGYHAGFAGAALALEVWAWQLNHSEPFPGVESYPNEDALITGVKKALDEGAKKAGRHPRVIVIGALGRCGSGAVDALLKAGLPEENILKWDMAETAKGGPFSASTLTPHPCLSYANVLHRGAHRQRHLCQLHLPDQQDPQFW